MNIRSKLLLSYSIMLATVFVVAGVSIWSIKRWRSAASELTVTREQSFLAERLRTAMTRKVNLGIDYLDGEDISPSDFEKVENQIHSFISPLKEQAESTAERDHIIGLEQTHEELSWVINSFRSLSGSPAVPFDPVSERRRLREIADEVSDDVAALNQYYRGKVDKSVLAASEAGQSATWAIFGSVLVAFLQLVAMAAQMQRWLVKPFADVKTATSAISKGKLETRISNVSDDEWGELAQSINEMARSLKTLQQQLATQERFAALGELGAYTAHNIRNPLAGIRAAIQVMIPDIPDTHADVRETMSEVINTIDRLDAWVKGFLEFARPLELKCSPTDINSLVGNVLEVVHGKFSQDGVLVESELDEHLPLLEIDPILVEQAIAALVTNACESGANHVAVATSSSVSDDERQSLRVTIADNGRGISEAMQSKLFRVFSTDKRGGTGLGLAQAKKIIELHSGSLTLEHSSNKGTSFAINLPLTESSAGVEPQGNI